MTDEQKRTLAELAAFQEWERTTGNLTPFSAWKARALLTASAPNPSVEPVALKDIRDFQRELANYFDDVGDPHGATMIRNFADLSGYTAPLATPSDKQEAVAEIVRYETFTGRTAWDIKIRDTSLKNGSKLYAAPLAQSAEQDRIDAEQLEGLIARLNIHAGNKDNTAFARSTMRECIEVLAALESRVLAERKQEPVAWRSKWKTGNQWTYSNSKPYCNPPEKFDVEPVFANPTPDDASTDHKFAIIKDRHYDGEGLTLWVWDGRYYCGTDGDCLRAHPDGSLDGFDCEWLTHDQLEQRLNAAIDRAMQDKEPK
jgi:hypothetical protein